MRICLLSSGVLRVPPLGYGGLEQVVADLGECLTDMGHEVYMVAPTGSEVKGVNLIDCGPCSSDARQWEADAFQKYAPWLMSEDNKDMVIHCHQWTKPIYLLKRDNPRLNVLSTLHGMLPYDSPPPVEHPNMVGISQHHAGSISKGLNVAAKFVYNGIDLDKYKYKEHVSNGRFLFLARMTPFKGAHVFVDLLKLLGLEGDLVGDDQMVEDQNYVMQLMKNCSDYGKIRYWGGVSREKTVDFFSKSRCYILPCTPGWEEPFGLTVVEAMACGCPVVATASGAIPELVEHGVTGFVAKNIQELPIYLKDGIIDTIKSEDCRERAEFFSRENMATNYLKLYESVLEGKNW